MYLLNQLVATQAAQQQLLAQLAQQPAAVAPVASVLPYNLKIGNYRELEEGRKNVRAWAEGVPSWLKLVGWALDGSQTSCILYLAGRLTGRTASGWWRSCVQQHGEGGGFATLTEFLAGLVAACGVQNAVERAREGLITMEQKGGVSDYATKFAQLVAELPAQGSGGDGWLAYLFLRGLKSSLRAIILGKFTSESATWLQIRDVAILHDGVAREAASVWEAAASSPADPMELGYASDGSGDGGGARRNGRGAEENNGAAARGRSRPATPRRGGEREGRNSKAEFNGKCYRCHEWGHLKKDCPKAG
jgi:hypothetical protein